MIFRSQGGGDGELNGFVDAGSHLTGELRFATTFRVDGKVEGTIVSDGNLVVGEGGEVDAEVRVGQIFISGTVRGVIRVSRRVHLCASGKLLGDVETPSLVIEDGAVFEGRCSMIRTSEPRAAEGRSGEPRSDQPAEPGPGRGTVQPLKPVASQRGGRGG